MDSNAPPPPPAPPMIPPAPAPVPRGRSYGWMIFALLLLAVLLVIGLFTIRDFFGSFVEGKGGAARMGGPRLQEQIVEYHASPNKIAVIPVEGVITSHTFGRGGYNMVYLIEDQLKLAARDQSVKAVILKVNSPGGEVMASDDIYHAVADFQKKHHKPVVAAMSSLAASGGYYVSAPCRWIVANELTITGSIGVIMHGYNYRGLMDKVGLRPEVYKSGKFKDMLSGEKAQAEITEAERMMIQNLVDETFAKFKSVVAEGRGHANTQNAASADPGRKLDDSWVEYADGRILSGKQAYDLGFIDELGNLETAVARALTLAKIDSANLIEYQQVFDLSSFFRIFGQAETKTTTLKVDLGLDFPKLQAGQLYFLSPTFVR